MVRPIAKTISMEISDKTIDRELEDLRDSISDKGALKAYERLLFVKMRKAGISLETARGIIGISKPTAYEWQDRWNESGLDSIRPNYAGGAPRRLDDDQMERVRDELNRRGTMTTGEIQEFIEEEFDVSYSSKQVAVRMRSIGAKFAKPYVKDYRSPDDADGVLKKTSAGRWSL